MGQIFSGIVIAVVSGWILSLFGIGKSKTVVHIHGHKNTSKKWKISIIIGWVMFIGGAYYGIAWLSVLGFTDPRPGIGLSASILGLLILLAGKFWSFWNS